MNTTQNKRNLAGMTGLAIGVLALAGVLSGGCARERDCCAEHGNLAREHEEHEGRETSTPIALSDLPGAVRSALAGLTADSAVTRVTRDQKGGRTTYDVEYLKGGAQWAAEFSQEGAVLENELDDETEGDQDSHGD